MGYPPSSSSPEQRAFWKARRSARLSPVEIPTHLSGVHKALMKYGYSMGQKYGRGFKKNVRFDDIMGSFCIDIHLPGSKPTDWITVSHGQAVEDLRSEPTRLLSDRRRTSQADPLPPVSMRWNKEQALRVRLAHRLRHPKAKDRGDHRNSGQEGARSTLRSRI